MIRNAFNQASESIQGTGAEAKKEGNKSESPSSSVQFAGLPCWSMEAGVAKDSNAGLGDRASAAKDALGNKAEETKHDVSLFHFYFPVDLD